MFFNNNLADANAFDYPTFGPDAYPFETDGGEPSTRVAQASGSDLGLALDNLSTDEIENWWLAPKPDGGAGQYMGSTLLDSSWGEFVGPYDTQAGYSPRTTESNTDYGFGSNAPGQRYVDAPEHTRFPTAGPSTTPYPARPAQLPSPPLATLTGPIATPSPVPTLSWGYSPHPPDMYTAAGNGRPAMYDQPLTAPDLRGQWPYPTSVGKGKARATDHLPPAHPSTTGDAMWRCQQPYAPENFEAGLNPQMGIGVPNTDLPTQVPPSTGPRRSVKRVKSKGKGIDKGEGKRKRIPKKDLAPGINWPNTCGRFCAEMAKIYLDQPTGEVINPETAYASITKFVKEDLHLSPLLVKPLGERQSRELEQYLIGVLTELRPRVSGQKKGVRYMLERVADKLEDGLVVVNDDFALLDGPPNEIDPEELDASEEAVKRRLAEKARRDSIRQSLERMTLFFRLPDPEYLFSRPQVLFFAITYFVFGAGVFGDGGEFFTPKP